MPACDREFIAALEAIVGPGAVRSGDLAERLDPGLAPGNLDARVMVRPGSTAEVARIVALCAERGVSVVPQGGRTGLSGGALSRSGQLIVDMGAMNRIERLDADGMTACVEAGVPLEMLQDAARIHGLSPGIDLGARGSATIGGMISTNAGGIEAFRHGTMAHRILGLEAVLASGEVVDELKHVPKANEGYRLSQLFCGAEGTLGIVTRAVIRLEPVPGQVETALVCAADASGALGLYHRMRGADRVTLRAAEIMWADYARTAAGDLKLEDLLVFAPPDTPVFALFEAESSSRDIFEDELAGAAEAGEILNALVAASERERLQFWHLREDSWAIDRQFPHGFWYDISVPGPRLDTYVAGLQARITKLDAGLRTFVMGHLGDGNLHITVSSGRHAPELKDTVSEAVYAGLADMGGSFSAEHGIGEDKRAALAAQTPEARLDAMRAIKRALDPHGIMNPGKVL